MKRVMVAVVVLALVAGCTSATHEAEEKFGKQWSELSCIERAKAHLAAGNETGSESQQGHAEMAQAYIMMHESNASCRAESEVEI